MPNMPNEDEWKQRQNVFLEELDGMIESTQEFIGDDELAREQDPEGRFEDLDALQHVRELYCLFYDISE